MRKSYEQIIRATKMYCNFWLSIPRSLYLSLPISLAFSLFFISSCFARISTSFRHRWENFLVLFSPFCSFIFLFWFFVFVIRSPLSNSYNILPIWRSKVNFQLSVCLCMLVLLWIFTEFLHWIMTREWKRERKQSDMKKNSAHKLKAEAKDSTIFLRLLSTSS